MFRSLTASQDTVKARAVHLLDLLTPILGSRGKCSVEQDTAEVGSGSLAATTLPTSVVVCTIEGLPPDELARQLRLSSTPVIGRIRDQSLLLDCRTIADDEVQLVAKAIKEIVHHG